MPTMKPGPSRNVQSLIAASADGDRACIRAVASSVQAHDREDADEADGDEGASPRDEP